MRNIHIKQRKQVIRLYNTIRSDISPHVFEKLHDIFYGGLFNTLNVDLRIPIIRRMARVEYHGE
jgi:hypothetical protein